MPSPITERLWVYFSEVADLLQRAKGHPKTGARTKGGIDKIKREAILAAQGITPLDYMMQLVRAETPPGLDPAVAKIRETSRFEAAKAAAPYVHARLQAVTLGAAAIPKTRSRSTTCRSWKLLGVSPFC